MDEGLKCFMWHKVTAQSEGKILSDINKTYDVVRIKFWVIKKKYGNKLSVVGIKMFYYMCTKTRRNNIRNDNIKECVG